MLKVSTVFLYEPSFPWECSKVSAKSCIVVTITKSSVYRCDVQILRSKWSINMNNLFLSSVCSPVETFIFNIPAFFSLHFNSALLVPMGSTHSCTKRSKRWLLVGSKARSAQFVEKTIKPTHSHGSNSVLISLAFSVCACFIQTHPPGGHSRVCVCSHLLYVCFEFL